MDVKTETLRLLKNNKNFAARVENLLKLIEEKDKVVNSFIALNPDVLQQARQIEGLIHENKAGMLAGLVIAVKSNICVKGLITSCASKTLQNFKAPYDADVVRNVKQEHGLIIGMTNMDEFAAGSSGETSFFKPTRNPLNPELIPGGSSSGSAAAVAAGFADLALGTDTGGSVRNPASHCGVVGFRPTYGLISRYGLIDLAMSFDTVGVLSRDVYGAALLLEVISKGKHFDATSFPNAEQYFTKAAQQVLQANLESFKHLNIGIVKEFETLTDKTILKVINNAIEKFASETNSNIVELSLKHLNLGVQTYYPIVYTEFFSATRRFDGRKYGLPIENVSGSEVLRRILGGREISKAEFKGRYYRKARAALKLIKQELTDAFKKVDFIASATVPRPPHKLGTKLSVEEMYSYDALTIPASVSGIPAGTVPVVKQPFAIGLQVMAPEFQDVKVLKILRMFELL
ncbi:aspartyl/glutamyl-tRNA amidotransferase subunit A [Candidatus Woesearchaeota archaeon]|nr:aspartyl/glutamyl-tRNA amidotransferase subunit A [Candidatus Woesearchaeota archaeon]